MFDLYKQLYFNGVTMTIIPVNVPGNMVYVKFERNNRDMCRSVDLSKFADLQWERDHMLVRVLEEYLREFLDICHKASMEELRKAIRSVCEQEQKDFLEERRKMLAEKRSETVLGTATDGGENT